METTDPRRSRSRALTALVALLISALALPALALAETLAGTSPPPVAPGTARIWIYREYTPYVSVARPYVRLNGAIVGISEPAGAFYRDVSPGSYLVTVDSDGTAPYQFVTVGALPGQQVFVKVLADNSWASGGGGGGGDHGGGGGGGWARDTFYTWQMQPQAAVTEIARMPLYNGG